MGKKETFGLGDEATFDLNQVMDEGMERFQGELNEAALENTPAGETPDKSGGDEDTPPSGETETTPPAEEAKKPEDENAPSGEETPPKEGQGADAPREPEAEAEPPKEKPPATPQPVDEKTLFELRRIRKENEQLRKDLAQSRRVEAERIARADRDDKLLDFMADEHEKAQEEIDKLDPEDPGYRKAVSRIQAGTALAVERWKRDNPVKVKPETPSGEKAKPEDENAPSGEETPPKEGQGADADREPEAGADTLDQTWETAKAIARESKIDPEDEYFRMACIHAPSQDKHGQPLSLEDQVAWAVQATKNYITKQERQFKAQQEKAAKKKSDDHQAENLPLGRTPATRTEPKPEDAPPVTLDSAVDSALEERRL